MIIEIEDLSTWPSEALTLLENNYSDLEGYSIRQNELNLVPSKDRYHAANEFEERRLLIVERLTDIINQHQIIGYHCTRLTQREVDRILNEGLQPLSLDLMEGRIQWAITDGFLSEEQAQYLRLDNQCGDFNRVGMLWFVFGRSSLQEEHAVVRLLRSWGGEALYNSHEESERGILRNIGMPCILQCSFSPRELKIFSALGEKFESAFLQSRSREFLKEHQFDAHIKQVLNPDKIIKLFRKGDPLFEELTNCHSWSESI